MNRCRNLYACKDPNLNAARFGAARSPFNTRMRVCPLCPTCRRPLPQMIISVTSGWSIGRRSQVKWQPETRCIYGCGSFESKTVPEVREVLKGFGVAVE